MGVEPTRDLIGKVARLTKAQTNRKYFSGIPVGTLFLILDVYSQMPDYDLEGYFFKYPPQQTEAGRYWYTGYIEKGSWELVGDITDVINELQNY